jgi:hypothetical protein
MAAASVSVRYTRDDLQGVRGFGPSVVSAESPCGAVSGCAASEAAPTLMRTPSVRPSCCATASRCARAPVASASSGGATALGVGSTRIFHQLNAVQCTVARLLARPLKLRRKARPRASSDWRRRRGTGAPVRASLGVHCRAASACQRPARYRFRFPELPAPAFILLPPNQCLFLRSSQCMLSCELAPCPLHVRFGMVRRAGQHRGCNLRAALRV